MELLLVIAVLGMFMGVSLTLYRSHHRAASVALVRQGVTTRLARLNDYYNSVPCTVSGQWQGPVSENVMDRLSLGPHAAEQLPYVRRYQAEVVDTGFRVGATKKPLYHLLISATLSAFYATHSALWAQALGASYRNDDTLYWDRMPNTASAISGQPLWVMDEQRRLFKHTYNHVIQKEELRSHAYCVR